MTEIGEKYAQSISWNLENETQNYLSNILMDYVLTKKVISYLKDQKNVTRDELIKRIGIFTNNKMSSYVTNSANTYIELLIFAEIIIDQGEELILNENIGKKEKVEIKVEESMEYTTKSIINSKEEFFPNINVTFQINSNFTEEEIVRLIKAIRKGLLISIDKDDIK